MEVSLINSEILSSGNIEFNMNTEVLFVVIMMILDGWWKWKAEAEEVGRTE